MSTLPAHTSPGALAAPLVLQPPPVAWTYAAATSWENYANGDYQQSVVQKEISLLAQANLGGYALTFETRNPAIREPKDAEALEEMALRLAGLYARVVVQAAPTGEVQALLNHEELLRNYTRQLTPELAQQLLKAWANWQEAYEQGLQEALVACLHRGMAQGVFRPDLNPEMLARLLRVQLGKLLHSEQFLLGEFAPEHVFPQLRQQFRNAVLLQA